MGMAMLGDVERVSAPSACAYERLDVAMRCF